MQNRKERNTGQRMFLRRARAQCQTGKAKPSQVLPANERRLGKPKPSVQRRLKKNPREPRRGAFPAQLPQGARRKLFGSSEEETERFGPMDLKRRTGASGGANCHMLTPESPNPWLILIGGCPLPFSGGFRPLLEGTPPLIVGGAY